MVDLFLKEYRLIKSNWSALIDESAQNSLKEVMNKIIWAQHIQSFDPNEWGQLSNFTGLQKKIYETNKTNIIEAAEKLQETIKALQDNFDKLKFEVTNLSLITQLFSTKPEILVKQANEIIQAYGNELKLKKQIVDGLLSLKYLNSPYEVIVTLTAMWSDKIYTNDRAISHFEKLLDFEAQSLKSYMNK